MGFPYTTEILLKMAVPNDVAEGTTLMKCASVWEIFIFYFCTLEFSYSFLAGDFIWGGFFLIRNFWNACEITHNCMVIPETIVEANSFLVENRIYFKVRKTNRVGIPSFPYYP